MAKIPLGKKTAIIATILIVGTAIIIAVFFSYNPISWLTQYLSTDTNPIVFAVLMALLPLVGMPLSIFLVLVGMIYGLTGAILLTGGLMLFHMVITYYLVHSLFRPLITGILHRFHMATPRLPQTNKKSVGLIFMLIPGLPYSAKNYLFAMTDTPFLTYLLISWPAQFGMAIPFIILGRGFLEMDPLILLTALGIILLGAFIQHYIRRRYGRSHQQDLGPRP